MENIKLDQNKIYKGYYVKDAQERFCFFKKISDELYIDAITKEDVRIGKIDIIEYNYSESEYKHCFKYFKNNKDNNVFLVKDIDTIIKNDFYNKILRFFDL